jgi:hypothetical protein
MWADNETGQDLLGFSIHANLLKSILLDQDMLPVTIGLFGDWGGGKSSILKILQAELESNDDCAVVYFNSWVFEGYEDAKSAILTALLNEIGKNKKLASHIGEGIKSLLKRVDWMRIAKLGATAGVAYFSGNPLPLYANLFGNTDESKKSQNEAKTPDKEKSNDLNFSDFIKDATKPIESIRTFRKDFEELIKSTRLKSLVVLIDDLDRCSPERVIENLEAIKLFLNVENTAFVVATDHRIIENAIRVRYSKLFKEEAFKGDGRGLTFVNDYLEKLIQVPYTLPKLAPHEVRSYMCMLFLKKHLPEEEFKKVLSEYSKFLVKERYSAFQLGDHANTIKDDNIRTLVIEGMRLVESCSEAITDGLKGNPRQIKRFLNAFWLRRKLADAANITHLKDHILIKLMVLEYINGDCFEDLYQWHRASDDGTPKKLSELEKAKSLDDLPEELLKWKTSRLLRWIKSEPQLSSEDLRDYFWVSRSSISDTLSGVRLMTIAMKSCVEDMISKLEAERTNGIKMFKSLTEEEQIGVLGTIARHAMQDASDDAALRSLIDLALEDYVNAAESFARCINHIGHEKLPPGLGVTLRSYKFADKSRASELMQKVINEISKSDTLIARTIKQKETKK